MASPPAPPLPVGRIRGLQKYDRWPAAGSKNMLNFVLALSRWLRTFVFQLYFTIPWKCSNRITSQLPWFYSTISREFSNRITAPAANLMQGPRTQLWQWFYFYSTIPRECWNRITSKCLDSIQTFPGNCWIELLLVPKTFYQSNFTEAVWLNSDSIQQYPGKCWIESMQAKGSSIPLNTSLIQWWKCYIFEFMVRDRPPIPPSL